MTPISKIWPIGLSLCISLAFLTGCDGASTPSDGGPGDAGPESAFQTQANEGASLYGQHCARCHGDGGEGTTGVPALVGLDEGALPLEPRAGAVRTTRFERVSDIAAFAAVNMPADDPGSLEVDEYYAILAFALSANGIQLEDELTPAMAEELVIPR